MESINNLKEVATKVIWGDSESNKEPISGVNGDVSKGEPYDAGNMEPSEVTTKDTAPDETGTAPVETETSQPKVTPPKETETAIKERPSISSSSSSSSSSSDAEIPSTNPTTVKDSSHLPGDSTKAQNDVRSPSDPDAHHENAAPKENVDDTGSGLDVGDNPEKLEGPGPKPIEQVAKEHGGDAGRSGCDNSVNKGLAGTAEPDSSNKPEERPKEESKDSGTGDLWVKSSGLAADGGNFDASAPGAGREADRLLEQKGVHVDHVEGHGKNDTHELEKTSSPKEKVSLKDKIKAKLHHRKEATAA